MSGPFWDSFEQDAEEAFLYLTTQYATMIVGERIKHFEIGPASGGTVAYYRRIRQEDRLGLQAALLRWIHQEEISGRLFSRENWLPFRHSLYHEYSYLGYRGLMVYNEYIFQLGVDLYEWDYGTCVDCEREQSTDTVPHFAAMVYGKKEEGVMGEDNWIVDWRRQ